MAVKIKESTTSTAYNPRFDFDSGQASVDGQTATIKELLSELNHQKGDISTADYNLQSIHTTLRFVASISGFEVPKRIDQAFPVTAIKTIKLLFKCSQFVDSHLLRILALPGPNSPANVDFFTSPATPETEDVKRQIDRIISSLEREICESEITEIKDICDPNRSREKYLQDTNEAIDRILLTHIHLDDDLVERADDCLTERTHEFLESISPLIREPRLHVAMYTYLKLLDYVHRLYFETSTQLTIPNDRGVTNKRVDFSRICNALSGILQRPVAIDTNFMSIDDAIAFTDEHPSDIASLVSDATGFKYNRRDVLKDNKRALIALRLYLSAVGLPNERNQKPIGVVHVVAAYCSVLHQRKLKSKAPKNSKKYGSRLSAPQRLLDAYIDGEATHIPSTVLFTYQERAKWYVHALLGKKHKADAHIAVQISQSELSRHIFMSLDHAQIRRLIGAYRDFMTTAADDFIALHGRQNQKYEWKHGG